MDRGLEHFKYDMQCSTAPNGLSTATLGVVLKSTLHANLKKIIVQLV